MANTQTEIVSTLNELIELNNDSIAGYEQAVEGVEDAGYREMLRDYGQRHRRFVRELTELVVRHSGEPEQGRTTAGSLRNAWMGLTAAVSDNDGAVLAICAEAAEAALKAYRRAMGSLALETGEVRDVVREQMSRLRLMHQKVHDLSTALR